MMMQNAASPRSLLVGFISTVWASVTAVFVVVGIVYYGIAEAEITEKQQLRAQSIADALKTSIAPFMQSYSIEEYLALTTHELSRPDLDFIIIHDRRMAEVNGVEDFVVGRVHRPDGSITAYDPDSPEHAALAGDCRFLSKAEIQDAAGASIGRVAVCASEEPLKEAVEHVLYEVGVAGFGIALSLSLILSTAFYRQILHPLQIIAAGLRETDDHGLPAGPVDENAPAEISNLARSLNKMTELARQSFDLITLTNKRLRLQEHELRKAETALSEIIWGTNAGTWEWNIATGETRFNERWAQIIGRTLEEISPVSIETWVEYAHPEDLPASNEALKKCWSGERDFYDCVVRMQHKSGRWVWVHDRGKVVEWSETGEPLRMSGTHVDVTSDREAQFEIKRLLDLQRLILDSVQEGIYGIDKTGNILFVNQPGAALLGYDADDMTGRPSHPLFHHHTGDGAVYPAEDCPVRKTCRDGKAREIRDEVFWKKDGSAVPVEYSATPLKDHEGSVNGAVVVYRSIEERTRLLAELERSNAELEHFAYAVSHDLRQPLRMISGFSAMLERKIKDTLDDDSRELFHFIRDGAQRLDQMMLSLLEYSRIGRADLGMQETDTRACLDEALRFLAPQIPENAAITVAGEFPVLVADKDELVRLFLNLIGNALKYRSPQRPCTIDVTGSLQAGMWRVGISDNGLGFPAENGDRLFKIFQRLHTADGLEGAGVGLALCRRIVEHHGGTIAGRSEGPEKGADFTFEIPLVRQNPAE